MGRVDSVGAVLPGQRADLVLLDGNPLLDIRNTSRIQAVVLNGRLLTRQDLDQLLSHAERVARQREPKN
jgi:imidazolonepropionase-like amidohydrolase